METQDQGRPMTHETFEKLRQLRDRIKRNHPGQTFDDSTELIRQIRKERSQYLADLLHLPYFLLDECSLLQPHG